MGIRTSQKRAHGFSSIGPGKHLKVKVVCFSLSKDVEADESSFGGLEKNKHKYKNRGTDHIRAKVVKDTK